MSKTVIDIFRFIISAVSPNFLKVKAYQIQQLNVFKLNGNFHCTCCEEAGSELTSAHAQ